VRIRVGEPIARRPDEDRAALVERVHGEMAGTLARWRGTAPDAATG
jgi:hypothetical protein